ncbi:MAG: SdrD B-like domain-containing protein [Mariprofundaceae bacterium]|nr:SdrD B-like domain-containing protein [Mariprofundaceae bacterium]
MDLRYLARHHFIFVFIMLLILVVTVFSHTALAHNVGQAQTSKFFDPDTVQMLKDRASGAASGGPGLRQGDIISYIVESVPAPNGATLGAAGYILDYIPPGTEVVGASFVNKIPDPTKYDGWAYIDGSMPYPGILADGFGPRGLGGYLPPFGEGCLACGVQDTGVFYSTDARTARLVIPYNITTCTKAKLSGTQLAFLVYNQWDYDQFMGFGNTKNCAPIAPALYPDPAILTGGSGRGNPPLVDLSGLGTGPWAGLASPVAGADTFYKNDFNPLGDGNGAINSPLDFSGQGPWHRIQHPGSLMGSSGIVSPVLVSGTDTITGVPATGGWALSSANPLPRTTNTLRFAIGERVVGDLEHVRVKLRIYDLPAFGAGSPALCIPTTMPGGNCAIDPYTNLSSVFGADASGGAQNGKDHAYAYLGPSQANNNAQLVTTKAVVAVAAAVTGPWIASDGAFLQIGQFVKYRLTYLNAASATLTNVTISDLIDPSSATYAGSASTGNPFLGIPTVLGSTVSWPIIAILMPGGGGNVELIVQITGAGVGGISSNQIFGTATAPDGATIVDSYAAAVSTIGTSSVPLINLSKTATPNAVATGQAIHYTIVLNNPGGAITAAARGNNNAAKGNVYPATASATAGLIIGDNLPKTLLVNDVTYNAAASTLITFTDTTTGIQYPLAAGDFAVDVVTRPGDVFWDVLTFPALHPRAGLAFDFVNTSIQIDFYATAAVTALPGVYYNNIEAYVGDAFSGKDITKLAINQAPVTIGAAPSFANSTKIAVDLNGGILKPGEDVRYDFTLINNGQAATTTLSMIDPIPNGANFVLGSVLAPSATISYLDQYSAVYTPVGTAGTVDPYVRFVRLNYTIIAIGASVTPSLTVRVPIPNINGLQLLNQGVMDVYAGINYSRFVTDDPNQTGIQDVTKISVTAKPDFTTTTKTVLVNGAASTQTAPGDALQYTINFIDAGTSSNGSTNVTVKDTVDLTRLENTVLAVTPVGWGVLGPDPYTGLIVWTAATLPHGASATFGFTADVKLNVVNGDSVNNAVVIASDQTANITINAPTLTVPTTKVTGTVFDDQNSDGTQQAGTEGGVQNVTVALRVPGFAGDIIIASTDANGYYQLIAPIAGDWYVQVTDDFSVLTGRGLTTANNPIAINLPNGITTTNQDFGYAPLPTPAVISGTVFNDADANGVQNGGEGGHNGVTLTLKNAANVIVGSRTTNASGAYDFSGLSAGNYTLEISDTSGILIDYYLTTGLVSPYSVVNLTTLETRTVDFGYNLGKTIGDLVFNDLDSSGTWTAGDSPIAGIVMELRPPGGGVGTAIKSAITDSYGFYQIHGIAPGFYDVYADATGILAGFTLTTGMPSPTPSTISGGGTTGLFDYGYVALPVINVTKITSTGVVGFYDAAEYTITVTNTGGAAANFVVRDILPTTTPPLTVPPYTISSSGFLYLSTNSVRLNGTAFTIPVMPTLYGTQPTWSGFTMPAASTLSIQFTAFSGANEGVNYNGVQTEYNNTGVPPATVQNFPDLARILISDVGAVTKRVAAINGVLWAGAGTPVVAGNDVISYEVQITNTPAALAHAIRAMRDYLPTGFTYKAGTAFVTDAINYPTGVAVIGTQLGKQLDFAMPLPNPSTGASYPGTVTLNFNAYAATGTMGTFTDNAGMLVSVNALPAIDVYSGNTAAVTLTQFRIGDTVFFDNDANASLTVGDTYAAGVTLELRPSGGGVGSAIASTATDNNGYYGFLINTAGTYDVVVTDTGGILLGHASSTGGKTQTATINALNSNIKTVDFGYIPPALSAVIEGTVFADYNNNTTKDASEPGIAAATLGLYNLFGTLINTYSTPAGGTFRFAGIAGGLYQINVITPPVGYGGTSIALPLSVNVADGTSATGNNIGYLPFGSLSGNLFSDTNGDGIKQAGETSSFAGVIVQRYNAAMVLIDSYASDANGDYIFPLIAAADYYVQVQAGTSPVGYGASTTQPIAVTVQNAVINSGNNIGYQPNGNVAGIIFLDANANGNKDAGENTIFANLVVDRYTIGMGFIDSYTADVNGQFQFNLLPAGDYYVQVRIDPVGYGPTTVQARKVTAVNGITSTGNDLGYQIFGSIGGAVFSDANGNAIMDGGEAGLTGVVVDRYSGSLYIDSYTADASGAFQFGPTNAGSYDLYAQIPTGYGATTGQPLIAIATLGGNSTGNNIGFQQAATISGKVFADVNNSGAFDAGDAWLAGATVYLKKAGVTVDTYTTTAGGAYIFTGLLLGSNPSVVYTVDVDQTLTPINNATLTTANDPSTVTVTIGSTNTVADIGYLIQGSISGTVYEDKNATLIFDTTPLPADTALTGAVVNLYDSTMALITATNSAVDGSFSFAGLIGADYYVEVITPATYSAVAPTITAPATQPIRAITLASGTVLTGQNFGFSLPPNLVVSKTTASPFVSRDVPITYTITVSNTGGTANNVVVTDWVPNLTFVGWLGVPVPTPSPEGVITPSVTATQLWFNGILVSATLPLAPYTQTTVANTTTAWSMAPTGFTLNNGDVLKFIFTVDSLANGTEGTFFNALQVDYLNGAIPVTNWYADINTVTATRTYFPDKQVVAINGVAWGGGVPTIDVGDTVTYAVTITNLRGRGRINRDEIAAVSLTDTLPLGFKYVLGSTKVISPGNGITILTPLAVDGVVLPVASALVQEVITYTFNAGAIPAKGGLPVVGDSMITGPSLNDTATLQFDAYAYDALTPNAPLPGTYTNRAAPSANRLGKGAGIVETIVGAAVTVSANAHVFGTVFHELTLDGVYNAATLDTAFNGITVELQPAGGGLAIDSYTTASNGLFDLIAPGAGSYQVVITDTAGILTGFINSIAPAVMPITLSNGQRLLGQDYGYVLSAAPATISGTIFTDANADGIQNGADAGIASATVNLTSLVGTILATALTNATGLYTFNNLAAGSYKIDVLNSSLPLIGRYNTPAAAPVDPYTLTIAAGNTSSQSFGWAPGAQFIGTVFDDNNDGIFTLGEPGHANITMNLVDTTSGTVIRTATTAYSPTAPAITPKLGSYNFDAVAPGNYRIDITDTFGGLLGYALTTANQPMPPLAVTGGITYTNNFGYFKAPSISVVKTMLSGTLDRGSKMDVTLTVSNTGGGVSAFSVADVMPSLAPLSPFVGGLGGFTPSIVPFVFDAQFTVKLDGITLAVGVDYTAPIAASATPTWTLNNGLPGGSVLEIHFTGIQAGGAGNRGSPNYNGAAIQYGTPATVVDYPNLITFSVVRDLTFSKRISAINGVVYAGTGRPVIYPGDRITFQLAVANTIRGRQIDVTSFGDTLPADALGYGLSYVAGTSILTNPFGGLPPAIIPDPTIIQYATPGIAPYSTLAGASQGLAWAAFVAPLPATLASFPSEVVLQFDAYADPSYLPGLYINQGTAMAARTGKAVVLINASRDFELTYNLTINKTVNRSSTPPGTFVTYTVSITNHAATGSVAGLSLFDQLANGFSYMLGTSKFNGVTTADPTGISTQPTWALPSIAAGATLIVSFSADVASWIPLGTYNNTATLKDSRAVTVVTTGATAPVSIAAQGLLTVIKQSNVARAAPGGVIAYTVTTQNTGVGVASNVIATDHLSEYVMLATDPWGNGTPVQFTDGANASGLTLGGITYSNDGGSTFAYSLNMGLTYDPYVTDFKVQMSGIMNANQTANPKFNLQYKVQVK